MNGAVKICALCNSFDSFVKVLISDLFLLVRNRHAA